jgi:hypothetical protein
MKSITKALIAAASGMGFAARFNQMITPQIPVTMAAAGRTRSRIPGKARPAGSKLARKAAKGAVGLRISESINARNTREALSRLANSRARVRYY